MTIFRQSAGRGHWIDQWDPEDESFWDSIGQRVARKNLVLSMFT